jgi:hypothetical protein
MKGRPDDWTAVVRANWKRMTAYIVSSHHPFCLRMAKDEVRFIDRVMVHVPLDQITTLRPKKNWFMAVVVCPGDELAGLAAWAKGKDTGRVHFYLHRDADPSALAPWRDAGHPLSRVEEERFTTYGRMHAKLGLDLNDQVYGDFTP